MNMLQVPRYSLKGLFKNTLFIGNRLSSLCKLKLATTGKKKIWYENVSWKPIAEICTHGFMQSLISR